MPTHKKIARPIDLPDTEPEYGHLYIENDTENNPELFAPGVDSGKAKIKGETGFVRIGDTCVIKLKTGKKKGKKFTVTFRAPDGYKKPGDIDCEVADGCITTIIVAFGK